MRQEDYLNKLRVNKEESANYFNGTLLEGELNLHSKRIYVNKYIFDAYYIVTKFIIEKEEKIEFIYSMIRLLTYLA